MSAGRIAVFGGTFNPVHLGHLHLMESFRRVLNPDLTLMIPASIPPHKDAALASGRHRLRMLEIAAAPFPDVRVSDIELVRGGKSYTLLTLRSLRESYGENTRFFLIVGGDMYRQFEQWHEFREILELATLCTAAREHGEREVLYRQREHLLTAYGVETLVFDFDVMEVSSSVLRERIALGERPKLIPDGVMDYIDRHGLYRPMPVLGHEEQVAAYRRLCEETLSETRCRHSFAVAKMARELALRFGASPEKAEIAGLLHDICKEMPKRGQLQMLKNSDIIVDNHLLAARNVWHAFAGAVYCREELDIEDEEILSAIRWHTTGRAGMSLLETILFVADLTSDDRDYPDVKRMRFLARSDLQAAVREAVRFIIPDLVRRDKNIYHATVELYNSVIG